MTIFLTGLSSTSYRLCRINKTGELRKAKQKKPKVKEKKTKGRSGT